MMFVALDRYLVVKKFEPLGRRIARERMLPYIVAVVGLLSSILTLLESVS